MTRVVTRPPDDPAGGELGDGLSPAGWWHESEDGQRLVCDACPRSCSLSEGDRGFCFVRRNVDGRIVLTTYGRSTGFCIDPIEKKPLNHFLPGTSILSFGTAGCNLGCKFCQNWTSSKSREVDRLGDEALPEAIAEAASRHECPSVALTYNDPIVWIEYAVDTARACRRRGIKTVAVTSGYMQPESRRAFYESIDAANVDLKAFSDDFYRKLAGGRLEPVLDTLRYLVHETDVWVEITNLIIPRENDSPDELKGMCGWIVEQLGPDVPLHFTAFHPDFHLRDRGPTPPETLAMAHEIAKASGIRYPYTGNLSDPNRQSTFCPSCDQAVIGRDGYVLGIYSLNENRCGHCGDTISGRFETRPGNWGARRLPVRIADFAPPRQPRPPTQGASIMAEQTNDPTRSTDATNATVKPPELTEAQETLVLETAARRVASAVTGSAPEPVEQVLGDLASQRVLGAFVSLKRQGELRSCCGLLGQSIPLASAIEKASIRAATDDPRFPPISPTELEHLDLEVWLLGGMERVEATGEARVAEVIIGKHGLRIARGNQSGLLLPGVATEHELDARAFLEHVCRKAGLPTNAWLEDNTILYTFEGLAFGGPVNTILDDVTVPETAPDGPSPGEIAALAEFARNNLLAVAQGATPSFYLPGGFDGQVCGLSVTVHLGEPMGMIEASRVTMRAELPLQSTLFEMVQALGSSGGLRQLDFRTLGAARIGLAVYWDPAMHGLAEEPKLDGFQPARRALIGLDQGRWAITYNPEQTAGELVIAVLKRGEFLDPRSVMICSLAVASTEPTVLSTNVPQPQPGPKTRRPAVAGRFYPLSAEEVSGALDDLMPASPPTPQPHAAALVPHAGWIYSGRLAADVLSRIEMPATAVIVCPKHNRQGAEWAIAPNESWKFPGGSLASNLDAADRLAESVERFQLDAAAHHVEHAIEVQLPILARLSPELRVVGIAIHGGGYDQIVREAEQLAECVAAWESPPLWIISTDMNHFADDAHTRKVDRLALDALESLDPKRLFDTVFENRISMCGVLPTVLVMETLKRLGRLNRIESIGYTTSADATGDTARVVGYAGLLID